VDLNTKLGKCQTNVHAAFCDNIDTHYLRSTPGTGVQAFSEWTQEEVDLNTKLDRTVLESLRELITSTNGYIERVRVAGSVNRQLLRTVAVYITKIFVVLGMIKMDESIGFSSSGKNISLGRFHQSILGLIRVTLKLLKLYLVACM
jgi:hypothetical protein